jgi:SAM-dependent methyltransferase
MPACPSIWLTAQTSAPHQRSGRLLPASAPHPAKMLPDIAAHAIAHYSRPGDVVLDPMCGIGTTLIEAVRAGRRAVGCEYEPRWAGLAAENLAWARRNGHTAASTVLCADARSLTTLLPADLLGTVDLVITSPPYGSGVHGQVRSTRESGKPGVSKFDHRYGTDPNNLAHTGTPALMAGFTEILIQCRHALRPGGTVVVTARPWRERGGLVDLPTAVLDAGRRAGLQPVERCVALLGGVRDGRFIARPSFFQQTNIRRARGEGRPLSLIAHEDVLVLRRIDEPEPAPRTDPAPCPRRPVRRRCDAPCPRRADRSHWCTARPTRIARSPLWA